MRENIIKAKTKNQYFSAKNFYIKYRGIMKLFEDFIVIFMKSRVERRAVKINHRVKHTDNNNL